MRTVVASRVSSPVGFCTIYLFGEYRTADEAEEKLIGHNSKIVCEISH
jgi:hypothetical protein